MTDADPLLSSLCAVCHLNPHAYRCPRCSTLTCSLQCVKRHKKRAQCNGKRDPGAYVKISDLATPAGIDKDYNYLTSIERELDNADRDAAGRGIQLEAGLRGPGQRAGSKSNVQAGIERSGVIVTRAPKGMSRNKTNSTTWLKFSGCMEWTVEWVHPDGTKSLAQCDDSRPISKIYSAVCRNMSRKKRKNDASAPEAGSRRKRRSVDDATDGDGPRHTSSTDKSEQSVKSSHPNGAADAQESEPNSSLAESNLRFYLHCPSLPSRQTVTCPMKPEANLSGSLKGKVVLEYPTIFVFALAADQSLPAQFIEEEEYYTNARKEKITELECGRSEAKSLQDTGYQRPALGQIDPGRLVEVLGKDIGRT